MQVSTIICASTAFAHHGHENGLGTRIDDALR